MGLIAAMITIFATATSSAHELRPGYLEVNEITANEFSVVWKVPTLKARPLPVEPRFPASCETIKINSRERSGRTIIQKATIACSSSLSGQAIELTGLDSTLTDVLVRIQLLNGELLALRATPDAPSIEIYSNGRSSGTAATYFLLGIEHILFGADHLLFVFALVLIISSKRRLIETITAFTIAHSITLIAATLGWVSLPSRPVEAVIALSIVFLAHEIASKQEGSIRQTERWPWLVAFVFGLLHGFGFAGALTEIGLPRNDVFVALLTFNLGVEAGQLLFLAIVLGLLYGIKKFDARTPFDRFASYAIGITASFWLFERVL